MSFLTLLGVVWRLANGNSRRAGLLAVGLVASCPILGSFPVTVRPDLLAIALQTWGIALTLEGLRERRVSKGAAVAFAIAFCVKQHAIVSAGVATLLILVSWKRKVVAARDILAWSAIGTGIVVCYNGLEEILTRGEMFHAVFALSRLVRSDQSRGLGTCRDRRCSGRQAGDRPDRARGDDGEYSLFPGC